MAETDDERDASIRRRNRRTAIALASVALALFLGIVARYWYLR